MKKGGDVSGEYVYLGVANYMLFYLHISFITVISEYLHCIDMKQAQLTRKHSQ
ncbi:hypothetical protein I79_025786 [Cricetulus griseus]|uniref:Uncharacterized protein n=1 Tax=Cricetulus griseus TaxID=10029 RepID=G3IP82_CRIGR|nr:hypothetical protein I79_025786 [Cricetulus griseus]